MKNFDYSTNLTTKNNSITKEDVNMNTTTKNVENAKEDVNMNTTTKNNSITTESICQVSKKLFAIMHFNFNNQTIERQPHPSNDAFRFAMKRGINPEAEFFFVDCEIAFDDDELKAEWHNAIINGITIEDVLYKPLCTTPSGVKSAQSIWCTAEHLNMLSKKFRHGFIVNGIAMEPCKFFTRMGLCFSSSKPIDEVYPNFIVNFDKVHIIKDIVRDGKVISDGAIYIFSDEDNLPDEAATWRPLTKGAAIPCHRRVPDMELVDLWGNKFNLKDAQVVAFESTFKWSALCKSREHFIAALKESDISIAVRMNKHGLKNLTYQPLQTLRFSEEQITKLENYSKNYLDSLSTIENYIKLLPAETREAVAICPALSKDDYILKAAQTAYRKQKMALRGAAIPLCGKFYCITPDVIDLFGGEGLKAGECCIHSLPEGKLIMIRYPHTSEASWVILNNRHIDNGIVDRNVLSINNYDDTLHRLGGADYDGDKVFIVTNKEIDTLIKEVLNDMGPCAMPKPIEGKAKKYVFDKDNAAEIKTAYFMSVTTKSQIGSVSNKLSAAYAALHEAYLSGNDELIKKARELVTYFQLKVELTVDIEKHGNTYLEAPKSIKEFDKLMPEHIMYSKLSKRIGTPEKLVVDKSAYKFREACPLEQYSKFINENTVKASEFKLDVDGEFIYENLMFKGDLPHMNKKVFNRGTAMVDENGNILRDANGNVVTYVNHGSFDQLIYANSEELIKLGDKYNMNYSNMTELRSALIMKLMEMYAEHYGCTIKDVYNLVVFYIFTMNGDAALSYKRVFWQVLHSFAEEALTEKYGEAALNFELSDIDDESEEEEDIEY